jgi:hypothetical protein
MALSDAESQSNAVEDSPRPGELHAGRQVSHWYAWVLDRLAVRASSAPRHVADNEEAQAQHHGDSDNSRDSSTGARQQPLLLARLVRTTPLPKPEHGYSTQLLGKLTQPLPVSNTFQGGARFIILLRLIYRSTILLYALVLTANPYAGASLIFAAVILHFLREKGVYAVLGLPLPTIEGFWRRPFLVQSFWVSPSSQLLAPFGANCGLGMACGNDLA